jgi:hypothetical protein
MTGCCLAASWFDNLLTKVEIRSTITRTSHLAFDTKLHLTVPDGVLAAEDSGLSAFLSKYEFER